MWHSVALKTLIGFDIQFQRILFIVVLVLYLAVRLVETKQNCLSTQVNDWSNIYNYIKQHEVLSSHITSQQAATHFLDDQSKTSET